jgi:hypothetical protein
MDNDLLTVVIGWIFETVIGWGINWLVIIFGEEVDWYSWTPNSTFGIGNDSEIDVVKLLFWEYISGLIS